jgi:transcriptional regulator with XRE-family HTH domain
MMKNNIKKLRLEKKMTLDQVASKISLGIASVSKIENGQQNLYADTALQLAELFNVSVDYLLGREWENPKDTIIKTREFEFSDVLNKLSSYSDKQLYKLAGVIDFILENRDKYNPQQIKNTIDKVTNQN